MEHARCIAAGMRFLKPKNDIDIRSNVGRNFTSCPDSVWQPSLRALSVGNEIERAKPICDGSTSKLVFQGDRLSVTTSIVNFDLAFMRICQHSANFAVSRTQLVPSESAHIRPSLCTDDHEDARP